MFSEERIYRLIKIYPGIRDGVSFYESLREEIDTIKTGGRKVGRKKVDTR